MDRLADQSGKDFQGGSILYDGWDVPPVGGSKHPAVPLRKLWELVEDLRKINRGPGILPGAIPRKFSQFSDNYFSYLAK